MAAPDLSILQARLGHVFGDSSLLQLALTHPSLAHDLGANVQHNQRLEFLGDSVLGMILTRELYERFPQLGEGPLTKARAELVNRRSLAEQSRRLGLGEFLIMSRGELIHGGRERGSALADVFEAIIGAILLDGGYEAARTFVLHCFRESFGAFAALPTVSNPKGDLQERLQRNSQEAPHYELISATGPDHDRSFECAVFHGGREIGRGTGKSKRMAESDAAQNALNALPLPPSPASESK